MTDDDLAPFLADGWRAEGGALARDYRFADFAAAFGFMAEVALKAEAMNHHPDWSNIWNRVSVRLTTHDSGGLTELDLRLARAMDAAAAQRAG
ncbi:4a-hydroxytetrahydrobiopterin dehydratase [Candidatus Falkowbacteria bacterium]|nr:4a-hydroxytetrahydrobiopterin dehydratase [Candidatus Falkowbacteria bacterium]